MNDPDDTGVIEAQGDGAELFDAPALFFMTHEETIRRWRDLSERARNCQASYLRSLAPAVEELGERNELTLIEIDHSGWHHVYLTPPATPIVDENPVIALEFGWHRKFRMTTSNTLTPYVAIRTGRDELGYHARTLLLDGQSGVVREERAKRKMLGKKDPEWPVWQKVVAPEQWWADLDAYRAQVLEALGDLIGWSLPHIWRVIAELPTRSDSE